LIEIASTAKFLPEQTALQDAAGDKWQCDHKHALANGGRHAEGNLQVLCDWCHKHKSRSDVAVKAYNYKRRLAHAGIKQKRRPMPGSRDSAWKVTFGRGVVRR
jgi:hypothetical protein